MAIANEVYRIHAAEGSWKDVDIDSVTGEDTVTYTVAEVVNLAGTEVGDTGTVLLTTVTNERLYDKDGVTDTTEHVAE